MEFASLVLAAGLFLAGPAQSSCDCKVTISGSTCGSRLIPHERNRQVTLTIYGPKKSHVQLFFGKKLCKPLPMRPFGTCPIRLWAFMEIVGFTDDHGKMRVSFKVPPGFEGKVFIQAVVLKLKELKFASTNGVYLDCDD